MLAMPIDTVILLTIQGRTVEEAPYFDSFVFARVTYIGLHRYEVEIQQPKIEMDYEYSAWIDLPESEQAETVDGFENPFWVVEDLFERDFGLEDCELVTLNFSGPSKSTVWEFLLSYLSKSAHAQSPFFKFAQISVDGSRLTSDDDSDETVIAEQLRLGKSLSELSQHITFQEVGFEGRSRNALTSRISCALAGVVVGDPIEPIVDDDEPGHVLVPGAFGTDYSLTICGTWLVCEPDAVEEEHWDDGDEFSSSAYWTTTSHYVPKLRIENSNDFSSNAYSTIQKAILTSATISDSCRSSMLLTLL